MAKPVKNATDSTDSIGTIARAKGADAVSAVSEMEGTLPCPSLIQAACIEASRLRIAAALFAEQLGVTPQAVYLRKKDKLMQQWYYLDLPAPEPTQDEQDWELYKWWKAQHPERKHCYGCGLWFEATYKLQSRCKGCNQEHGSSHYEKKYQGPKNKTNYRPRIGTKPDAEADTELIP